MELNKTIPKIIHQIWIGKLPRPTSMMKTWKEKNPGYEYIFWNEKEIMKRNIKLRCIHKIRNMKEICGKADIIRWELLYMFGGIFIDADSICIEPLDDEILNNTAFASYENENHKPGLVANGTMGFVKNHPLCLGAINTILTKNISDKKAWIETGPGLLTRLLETKLYPDMKIYPSYYFLPVHYSSDTYLGHRKVYAYQAWGSTTKTYRCINSITLPSVCRDPNYYVSVLISNHNDNMFFVRNNLNSILEQVGHFGIQLIYINNGSSEEYTKDLESLLDDFKRNSRFIKLIYKKLDKFTDDTSVGKIFCTNTIVLEIDSKLSIEKDRIKSEINKLHIPKQIHKQMPKITPKIVKYNLKSLRKQLMHRRR